MKLEILIPHYKESEAEVQPLLDSIAIQQSVDLANEVGVIICHDGDESLDLDFSGRNYPFRVKQIRQGHKGVSSARNACLDESTAEYVMFADCDDMFCNVCGLWIIFREMETNGGFDSLTSMFIEETRLPGTKEVIYINHEMDSTFVHGKVHRRKYLLDKNIRWNDSLTIHEDSFFNILCQNLSGNVKYCPTAFYLWRWRDESVCRHDPKYILKTYRNMIDSNDALIGEFVNRGVQDKANFYVAFLIMDAYYTMNKPEWINQENREYRDSTERRFAKYYAKHKKRWEGISDTEKIQISQGVRGRSVSEGMQMETMTITEWLKHVETLI